MKRNLLLAALLMVQSGSVACFRPAQVVRADQGQGLLSLFDGFAYVGTDVDPQSHNKTGLDAPRSFLPGRQYFFHHTRPFDSFEFGGDTLPRRLRGMGFSITKKLEEGSFATSDSGGEFWKVQFSRGSCFGEVSAHGCSSPDAGGTRETETGP